METFYSILSFVLLLALLYLVLNFRMMKMLDQKFNDVYKNRLQTDMQEFYREMESYSALLENRIRNYKALVERQEQNLKKWEGVFTDIKKSRKGKQIAEYVETSLNREKELIQAIAKTQLPAGKKKAKSAGASPPTPSPKGEGASAPLPLPGEGEPAPSAKRTEVGVGATSTKPVQSAKPADASITAAEELVNSTQDQFEAPTKPAAAPEPAAEAGPADNMVVNFLSKVGQIVESVTKPNEPPGEQPAPSIEREANPVNFGKMLEKKQTEKSVAEEADAMRNQKLSNQELLQVMQDLHSAQKRPPALKMLLKKGYTLGYISDLANIPYSDLEATRQIYSI